MLSRLFTESSRTTRRSQQSDWRAVGVDTNFSNTNFPNFLAICKFARSSQKFLEELFWITPENGGTQVSLWRLPKSKWNFKTKFHKVMSSTCRRKSSFSRNLPTNMAGNGLQWIGTSCVSSSLSSSTRQFYYQLCKYGPWTYWVSFTHSVGNPQIFTGSHWCSPLVLFTGALHQLLLLYATNGDWFKGVNVEISHLLVTTGRIY